MKKIKILSGVLSIFLFTAIAVGCDSTNTNANTDEETQENSDQESAPESSLEISENAVEEEELIEGEQESTNDDAIAKTFKIGIVQYVQHKSLDAAYQGFIDKLTELGVNFEPQYYNAQGEQANLTTISQQIISSDVNLILAIATPAALTVANETKEIPIVGTAITDYVSAGLVDSNEQPGGNVTGASDMNPVDKQVQLIPQLVPGIQKVGIMYSSNEPNSQIQADMAKEEFDKLGIAYEEATISSVNDIQVVAQSLVGKGVEAIYVPTDNNIASAIPTLTTITEKEKIPVVTGSTDMVQDGGTATVGISYYELGEMTAQIAYEILVNGKTPAELPIQYMEQANFVYNNDTVEVIGLELSDDLVKSAMEVYSSADAE